MTAVSTTGVRDTPKTSTGLLDNKLYYGVAQSGIPRFPDVLTSLCWGRRVRLLHVLVRNRGSRRRGTSLHPQQSLLTTDSCIALSTIYRAVQGKASCKKFVPFPGHFLDLQFSSPAVESLHLRTTVPSVQDKIEVGSMPFVTFVDEKQYTQSWYMPCTQPTRQYSFLHIINLHPVHTAQIGRG